MAGEPKRNRPPHEVIPYPALVELFKEWFAAAAAANKPLSVRGLARELEVSQGTVNGWTLGKHFPNERNILDLCKYLGEAAPPDFERRLRQICQGRPDRKLPDSESASTGLPSEAARHDQILTMDDIRGRREPLNISYFAYPPFCGTTDPGFLDEFFGRLRDLGHINEKKFTSDLLQDAANLLQSNKRHVHLCMLDTPRLATDVHSLHSPCRITVNAVCLMKSLGKIIQPTNGKRKNDEPDRLERENIAIIQNILSDKLHYNKAAVKVITLKTDVGEHYIRDTLGFNSFEFAKALDTKGMANELIEAADHADGKTICVFLADDLTALRVMARCNKQWKEPATLVFPLATQESSKNSTKTKLPGYILSFAVSEKQTALKAYLQRAFELLLLTDIELISGLYQTLYDNLVSQVLKCLGALDAPDLLFFKQTQGEPVLNDALWKESCAARFARYTLRLDEDYGRLAGHSELPWHDIIYNVRERIKPLRDGTQSIREGKIKLAYRPIEPVCPPAQVRKLEVSPHERSRINLSQFGFMGELMKPFEHLIDPYEVYSLDADGDFWSPRFAGEEDVRIGTFETLDRQLNWIFIRIPYATPLNAVVLSDRGGKQIVDIDEIRALLLGREHPSSRLAKDTVGPIVLFGGSAYEYLLSRLQYSAARMHIVDELDEQEYAKRLLESRLRGETLRVAVVDVFTCLGILEKLDGNGQLLFPLYGSRDMPCFNVGIAVSRRSERWAAYLPKAMRAVLREAQEKSRAARLIVNLRDEVQGKIVSKLSAISEMYGNMAEALATPDFSDESAAAYRMADELVGFNRQSPAYLRSGREWRKIIDSILEQPPMRA